MSTFQESLDASVQAASDATRAAIATSKLIGSPADSAIATAMQNAGTQSNAYLNSTYASRYASATTAANTARIVSILKRGVSDATMLVIGDSTGNETTEWPQLLATRIGSRFPAYTVKIAYWDAVGGASYNTATTIQTGTGSQTLTIYNCSVAGSVPGYVLGSRWNAAVRDVPTPDLVIINHGHNMGDSSTWESSGQGRGMMMALTEEITAAHNLAGLVLTGQNPVTQTGRETWSAHKCNAWENLAGLRGYGFVDVHQAFWDYGNWQTDLMADTTHPNAAGQSLWTDVLDAAFTSSANSVPTAALTPATFTATTNYLVNSTFSGFAGATPDNWNATLCATSQDTTNYETGAYGVKVSASATSGTAFIDQSVALSTAGLLRGGYVTAAARVRVPASNTGTVRLMLLDNITGGGGATNIDVQSVTRDGFTWLFVTRYVDPATTSLYVRLVVRTSGTDLVDATFDRAYLVRGSLPLCG